jgi:hypothetical protein
MYSWRTWSSLIAIAAIGPTVFWASPFGPARNFDTAIRLLFLGYPAWVVFSIISLVPGLLFIRCFALRPWWALPCVAVLVQFLLGAITQWPPTRWWPLFIIGGQPVPSGHVFGIPIEAWHGYFYSLWPHTFMALVAALSLLVVRHFLRPNLRWSGP